MITYDIPVIRADEGGSEVTNITLLPSGKTNPDPHIYITVARLDPFDNFIGELTFIVGSQLEVDEGSADFTFAQYVAIDPTVAGLATRLEQALVDAGKLPTGTVS